MRRHLYAQVYPRLSAAREAFETALARLGWKRTPACACTRPQSLKAPIFSWKSNFGTPRNCNNSWAKSTA